MEFFEKQIQPRTKETKIMKSKFSVIAGVAAVGLLCSTYALAATQAVTANIAFDAAITLTKNADITFGTVQALTAGTYTIDTAAVVTPGGGGVVLGGSPVAGDILIQGSATQTINISVGGYTAGGIGGGVVPSAATCAYDSGAEAACTLNTQAAPTAAGKTLKVGVLVTVDALQTAGSVATPSFTVTVVYS